MKNSLKTVLRAMLAQLAGKDEFVASYLYERCCTKDQWGMFTDLEELTEIAFASQTAIYIVLDGLDECEPDETQKILLWFMARQAESSSLDHGHIRLLCVGQRTNVLQDVLSTAPQISLENAEHQRDVHHFIEQRAYCIQREFDVEPGCVDEIVKRISKVAKGKLSQSTMLGKLVS